MYHSGVLLQKSIILNNDFFAFPENLSIFATSLNVK